MKLPRDLSGRDLARRLSRLGYVRERQGGSHMQLVCPASGSRPRHRITVPDHDQMKVGTLSTILDKVAVAQGLSRDELLERLFG
ncbi:MAG: type II toxin-antitoxin system HicA family toxin [Candidatus Marsarchaeota archaeon]|nr:type II toxin-antitoxin system HicA family toxin [Candidatus Marsarchaeota archaeon]